MNNKKIMRYAMMLVIMLFAALSATAQNLHPKQDEKKGTWGYVDNSGKWVVKPKYSSAAEFKGSVGKVEKDGAIGFVDAKGKEVLKCKYSRVACSIEEKDYAIMAQEKNNPDKWLLFYPGQNAKFNYEVTKKIETDKGALLLKGDMSAAVFWSDPTAATVSIVLDKDGIITLFEKGGDFTKANQYYIYENSYKNPNNEEYLYSADGKLLFKARDIKTENNGFASFRKIDSDTTYYMSPERKIYKKIYSTGDEILAQSNDGDAIYLENSGMLIDRFERVIVVDYGYNDDNLKWSNGFYFFKDGKWGFNNGRYKILKYTTAGTKDKAPKWSYDGLKHIIYSVDEQNKHGILKEDGTVMIPCEYDSLSIMHAGGSGYIIKCHKGGKMLSYTWEWDKEYKQLTKLGEYDDIYRFRSYDFIVEKNGKKGVMAKTGKVLVPVRYCSIGLLVDAGSTGIR